MNTETIKPSQQQAELVRVLTSIAQRRIRSMVQTMTPEQVDKLWESLTVSQETE